MFQFGDSDRGKKENVDFFFFFFLMVVPLHLREVIDIIPAVNSWLKYQL